MEITKPEIVSEDVVISVVCNRCGKKFDSEQDWQNMLMVRMHMGYGSEIGDMTHVEFDMCEACLIEIMDEFKLPAKKTDCNEDGRGEE